MRLPPLVGAAIGLLMSGCSLILPDIESPRTATPVTLATWPAETEGRDCGGIGLGTLELHGDANAENGREVWVESEERGQLWPVWAHGWSATFDPELQVFDRDGDVVVTQGETFDAGGSLKVDGTVWLCEVGDRRGL